MTIYSAKDAQLAARILKPEYFDQVILGYLNDYFAVNQPPVPLSNVIGVNAAMTPIGSPVMWLTGTVPYGYVLLDGTSVSRTTYNLLFDLWGTTYGVGDGSTTFGLPDFRGRVPVGKGTHADVDTLGETEGAAVGDRRPAHKHTVTGGAHTHTITDSGHTHTAPRASDQGSPFDVFYPGITASGTLTTNSATTGISINSADATPTVGPQTNVPTDEPAYIVVNFITRYSTYATGQPVQELPQSTRN